MTNQLDSLLEAIEDALEDGEVQLWQPDLTDVVLPGRQDSQGDSPSEDSNPQHFRDEPGALPGFSHLDGQSLPRFQRAADQEMQGQQPSGSDGQTSSQAVIARSASPALLEQLNALEDTWAGVEALGRTQAGGSSLSPRSGAEQAGGGVRYDPAAQRDFPLAAAAAAAQQEEDARAVDRAFQRDSRRYDRGFSLY